EQMREAARRFEFERAAQLRDRLRALKQKDIGGLYQPAVLPRLEALPELVGAASSRGSASAGSRKRRKRPPAKTAGPGGSKNRG
ncbi:MAG: UvrB/UvrC motif-containing protein, partial [Terriglobia bacterium]